MTGTRRALHDLVDAMRGVAVGVVGDLVADIYVYGRPYKLSREAPVVIARHEEERLVPGGGANVLANLAALGARAHAAGSVGDDEAGRRLTDALRARGVDTSALAARGQTVTLVRYMVGAPNTRKQQVLRIDRFTEPTATADQAPLDLDPRVRAWIASDYGYGGVTAERARTLAERARSGILVAGDSRARLPWFQGFTLVKPNQAEAEDFLDLPVTTDEEARFAVGELARRLGVKLALVTRGNLGMVALDATTQPPSALALPPAGAREAVDVSGAGDTVMAVTVLALAAGADLATAATLANRGAGVVVMHEGTTPLAAAALHEAIDATWGDDDGDLAALETHVAYVAARGGTTWLAR